ncbi:MAG: LysR family transcriptional regulator [Parachlamydia sp.]|nr:LysR family transcriptional regulator [Parachlamydia sp.]
MPDLTQMETLVLTSELGSLAAVARKLGVSPAAISKQLTKLEEELGVQLLMRSTRRVALTDVGVSYCRQCRRILEEVAEASSLVSQIKTEPAGTLKVVSGRHFAATYLVPHLKEFLERYPKIEIDLELAERIPDFQSEEIDVMIGMSISAPFEAIQKRIASTTYCFCASPAYIQEFGTPESPQDLKKHRYITHSMRRPDHELVFSNKESLSLPPFIRVNDAQTMLHMALDGLGIVKLHQYVVKEYLESGALLELLAAYGKEEIPIYVAYPQRRFISSKVRCFIDFVTDKITY